MEKINRIIIVKNKMFDIQTDNKKITFSDFPANAYSICMILAYIFYLAKSINNDDIKGSFIVSFNYDNNVSIKIVNKTLGEFSYSFNDYSINYFDNCISSENVNKFINDIYKDFHIKSGMKVNNWYDLSFKIENSTLYLVS